MGYFDIDAEEYEIKIQIVNNGYIIGLAKDKSEEMEKVNVAIDVKDALRLAEAMLKEQTQKILEQKKNEK